MGEEKFNLNKAKLFIGRYANIHLKDGSVIVNVLVQKAQKNEEETKPMLHCVVSKHTKPIKIPLREIAWAETLNPNLLS